jgi:hypothetical protein
MLIPILVVLLLVLVICLIVVYTNPIHGSISRCRLSSRS